MNSQEHGMSAPAALAGYLSNPSPGSLLALNFGFTRSRVLETALELGVFAAIDRGVTTAQGLATELQCAEEGLVRLLEALVGLGLLCRKTELDFALTPLSSTYLVEGRGTYVGHHLRDVMLQWSSWEALTDVVRTGVARRDLGDPAARAEWPNFFGQNFPLSIEFAFDLARRLDVPPTARVLNLAAGGGEWGIGIALAHPEVRVVLHDAAPLLVFAKQRLAESGLTPRFSFAVAGEQPWFEAESFELVILPHVLRFAGSAEGRRLLHECARLLTPGGTLVVVDVIARDDMQDGADATLAMLNLSLLVNTRHGRVPHQREVTAWLAALDFALTEPWTRGVLSALVCRKART
jgi:2-polyprenyl-3-methyl-5-hydroxy-6-metoxy-1,4-benzoquinol methylase